MIDKFNIYLDQHPSIISSISNTPFKVTHLPLPPGLDRASFAKEAEYQIQLYQLFRDDAHDRSIIDKQYVTIASNYILPCVYALLGAFLFSYRWETQSKGRNKPPARRYAMAFMVGAIIGILGPIIASESPLTPFAIAFLAGYSIDAVISQLDRLVDRYIHLPSEK
jgi:hypothetical protein